MFPVAVMLPVALSVIAVMTLAPEMFPPDPLVVMLLAVTLPVADTEPLVLMLPLTDSNPVIYSPVVANTATLLVPPMPTVTLPPELTTVTLLVPLLILATLVITPVRLAPLPKK